MWKVPVSWGFWSLSAPHWTQTWTSISCLIANGYQRNSLTWGCERGRRKNKEARPPSMQEWAQDLMGLKMENVPVLGRGTQPRIWPLQGSPFLCGLRIRLTSLPLVRAMASSLSLQVLENKTHLISPLDSPQTWRVALLHQQCFGFQGHSGRGFLDYMLCVVLCL